MSMGGTRNDCLLICEHGGNAIPHALNGLGLPPADLQKHFAVDIGARTLTETIAARLDAAAICANYSRLIVDLNRFPQSPTLIVTTGDNNPVPGNLNLSKTDRLLRQKHFYDPFHDRISDWIDDRLKQKVTPTIITIHSYTPVLGQVARPHGVCVVSNTDRRIADHAITHFENAGFRVGDNMPFDGRKGLSATFNRHGAQRQLPHLMIEFRNDLLSDNKDIDRIATTFCAMLNALPHPL